MSSAIETRHLPVIRREDITWRTAGTDVQISIALHNDSPEPIGEATLVIEAAAFGAFVPSKPIARIAVAGFEPGERRRVMTRVARERLDEVVALGPKLKYDGPSWVGNLNVYFDVAPEEAVERHVAFDLKVQAGSKTGFRFFVFANSYSLDVRCSHSDWTAVATTPMSFYGEVVVTAPAEPGQKSKVDVTVARQPDGSTVLVEFEFETVEGASDTLGCVKV